LNCSRTKQTRRCANAVSSYSNKAPRSARISSNSSASPLVQQADLAKRFRLKRRKRWSARDATLPKPAVKVLLNLSQIALDALVRGGKLDIGAERRPSEYGGNNVEIVARATGNRIAFDETIGKALQGELDPSGITSRTAAAHMIALLAEEMGGGLQYAISDEALVLGAVLPEPEGMIG